MKPSESCATQTAMRWTIVRPTLAYNENGGEEYRTFVEFLKRWPVGIFVGRGRARKNPVHVDDLMRGFLAIPGNPRTYGKTYPLCGGEPTTLWEMGRLALAHEGITKPFVPLPVWLCRLAATVMGRDHAAGAVHRARDRGPDAGRVARLVGGARRPRVSAGGLPRGSGALADGRRRAPSRRGCGPPWPRSAAPRQPPMIGERGPTRAPAG